jgi:hypothetical protein
MARYASEAADKINAAFEDGVASGKITEAALFDFSYDPVEGTNPEQFIAPFTLLTADVLPEIQEAVLKQPDRIAYCVATDENCCVPTHNTAVSKTPGRRSRLEYGQLPEPALLQQCDGRARRAKYGATDPAILPARPRRRKTGIHQRDLGPHRRVRTSLGGACKRAT